MEARVEIQKDYIDHVVAAAMIEALGDKEAIIERVVMAAMEQKKDSYTKETMFMGDVKESIRKAAHDAFQEWLGENRDLVKKSLKKYLSTKEGLVDKLVKQVMTGLIDHVNVTVKLDGTY
uniref:Uncharacterized protein n=1 Tax=viral metagenome TaxID=1070528 RepID=A0A6M3J4G0_9ZZZZ